MGGPIDTKRKSNRGAVSPNIEVKTCLSSTGKQLLIRWYKWKCVIFPGRLNPPTLLYYGWRENPISWNS